MKILIIACLTLLILSVGVNAYLFTRLDRVETQMFALNDEPTLLDTLKISFGGR